MDKKPIFSDAEQLLSENDDKIYLKESSWRHISNAKAIFKNNKIANEFCRIKMNIDHNEFPTEIVESDHIDIGLYEAKVKTEIDIKSIPEVNSISDKIELKKPISTARKVGRPKGSKTKKKSGQLNGKQTNNNINYHMMPSDNTKRIIGYYGQKDMYSSKMPVYTQNNEQYYSNANKNTKFKMHAKNNIIPCLSEHGYYKENYNPLRYNNNARINNMEGDAYNNTLHGIRDTTKIEFYQINSYDKFDSKDCNRLHEKLPKNPSSSNGNHKIIRNYLPSNNRNKAKNTSKMKEIYIQPLQNEQGPSLFNENNPYAYIENSHVDQHKSYLASVPFRNTKNIHRDDNSGLEYIDDNNANKTTFFNNALFLKSNQEKCIEKQSSRECQNSIINNVFMGGKVKYLTSSMHIDDINYKVPYKENMTQDEFFVQILEFNKSIEIGIPDKKNFVVLYDIFRFSFSNGGFDKDVNLSELKGFLKQNYNFFAYLYSLYIYPFEQFCRNKTNIKIFKRSSDKIQETKIYNTPETN